MKASRYALYFDRGERVRVVSLLTGSVLELHSEAARALKTGATDGLPKALQDELRASLLLLPDQFNERELVLARTRQARENRDQLSLIITPTLGCNLNCHYCFEAKRDEVLSSPLLDQIATEVERRLPDYGGLHIQWFGGEPLQALPQIATLSAQLQATCRKSGKPYGAEIITNGVLLTAEVARELASWGVEGAQVTFDGASRLHDKVRFGVGHAGTFDTILDNLIAASAHLRIKVRVHVAPYSVDSVFELLDELAARQAPQLLDFLYFAPLFNYRQEGKAKPFAKDDRRFLSAADFASVQARLLQRAWALGFRTPDPLAVAHGICAAASKSSLVVNADGSLSKCYMDVGDRTEIVGELDRFAEALEEPTKWSTYEPTSDEECLSCRFLPVCLGGCPKQKMSKADKAVVCTPLKYNHQAVLGEYVWAEKTQPVPE